MPASSAPARAVKTRARDSITTKKQILDSAEVIFARDGFGNARVDVIAAQSGYNKSLIFQYFGDKAGLYQAVVTRVREKTDREFLEMFAPRAERMLAELNGSLEPGQVRTLLSDMVRFVFNHFAFVHQGRQLFVWNMAEGWDTFNLSTGQLDPALEFGVEFLRRAQRAGLLRHDVNPETIGMTVLTLPMALIASLPRFTEKLENVAGIQNLETLREHIVTLMLHAVLPDQAMTDEP
jgi:TetR/AcrR family transcriptional regulator